MSEFAWPEIVGGELNGSLLAALSFWTVISLFLSIYEGIDHTMSEHTAL